MHRARAEDGFRFQRSGFYQRKKDRKKVQRFVCMHCKRSFSQQSFDCTYYLKRPELLAPTFAGLNAGSAHRQLARSLGCAPSTITRLSQRLGRHGMLLHAKALAQLLSIDEAIVFDHFETFSFSQWDPVGIATPVGASSLFVYGLEPAPHCRGGKVSPYQQRKRDLKQVPPPPKGSVERSTRKVLDVLAERAPKEGTLELISDGHEAYVKALEANPQKARFTHEIYPNPKRGPKGAPRSKAAKARDQAMFPVDRLHGLLRHSSANHKRETIAFGRRTNALIERGYVFAAWRNFSKGRSERKGDKTTPAMTLGLTDEPWSWERMLARRLFVDRVTMPPGMMKAYRREWITPALGHNAQHTLKRAF